MMASAVYGPCVVGTACPGEVRLSRCVSRPFTPPDVTIGDRFLVAFAQHDSSGFPYGMRLSVLISKQVGQPPEATGMESISHCPVFGLSAPLTSL